jgi:hypothetical protein
MKLVAAVTSTQKEMKMSSIPKTDNETLAYQQTKVLCRATNIQKLTEVEQVNVENEWTEFLNTLVQFGNRSYLKSYTIRLEMELT